MNKPVLIGVIALLVMFSAISFISINSNAQDKVYKIGDKGPGGGFVFYDLGNTTNGWRYLEAAPEDQGKAKWGCLGKSIPGILGGGVGTGKENTAAIIKSCGESGIAAKVAAAYRGGGKSDWFLPSKSALNLMYENLHKAGVGGFAGDAYWSSSVDGASGGGAWLQGFSDGYEFSGSSKDLSLRVRAVRAF